MYFYLLLIESVLITTIVKKISSIRVKYRYLSLSNTG